MKKILFVLTLIVANGLAFSNVSAKAVVIEKNQITVVADNNDAGSSVLEEEKDKKKKTTKKACCSEKAAETKKAVGCTETQKKSCAASGKTCEGTKTTVTKSCCGKKK